MREYEECESDCAVKIREEAFNRKAKGPGIYYSSPSFGLFYTMIGKGTDTV
jgi:hypothetical protein